MSQNNYKLNKQIITMKLDFRLKHGKIEYIILGAITWIILFLGFYIIDYNETSAAEFLRTHLEQPPLNSDELKELIKLRIDNLNEVDNDSFTILTDKLAKDNLNIYYIQSYKDSRDNVVYTLVPLSLNFDIDINSLRPVFLPNYDNTSISTQFFEDINSIYFLHTLIRDSYSNSIFEPLQNVTMSSWNMIDNSNEFSFDENYLYFGSSILTNISSNGLEYFNDSYLYHNNILYFKNIPLVRFEYLNSFEKIFENSRFKLLKIDESIWIHQVNPQRNIFFQNISDVSSFRYVGGYRGNEQLFNKLEIDRIHDLFEDSQNYYSITSITLPLTGSVFGSRRVNYLEEIEVVQYFEIHPKE